VQCMGLLFRFPPLKSSRPLHKIIRVEQVEGVRWWSHPEPSRTPLSLPRPISLASLFCSVLHSLLDFSYPQYDIAFLFVSRPPCARAFSPTKGANFMRCQELNVMVACHDVQFPSHHPSNRARHGKGPLTSNFQHHPSSTSQEDKRAKTPFTMQLS